MSDNFEAEIKKLAQSRAEKSPQNENTAESDKPVNEDAKAALTEFFNISTRAAQIYNDALDDSPVQVYELTAEFLEIFLGITARAGGLSIVSRLKFAAFFDEEPDMITIIGKYRSHNKSLQSGLNKTVKLMQVTYSKTENGFEYKDNTGNELTLDAVITAVFGWLTNP